MTEKKSEEGNLSENGGESEVEESAGGAGDDRSGDRREGKEAGEGAEEEDEAGRAGHVEQVRRPRDSAGKLVETLVTVIMHSGGSPERRWRSP